MFIVKYKRFFPEIVDIKIYLLLFCAIDLFYSLGCQKEIVKAIVDKKSDYVLALKGNQKLFYNEVKEYLDDALETSFKDISHSYTKSFDKGHGRKEVREYYVTEDIDWFSSKQEWANLKSIGIAVRKSQEKRKTTIEKRYYISSLPADTVKFSNAVRKHWGLKVCIGYLM